MAIIYPERPPAILRNDPKRSSELFVYTVLETLPNTYRIFYNTHWQDTHKKYGANEGEADFIIAHPQKGVIILEVKGGGIRYDAHEDQWYSQDRHGEQHRIKDPVNQARRNHYHLLDKLVNLPGWPDKRVNTWYAVCFPDIRVPTGQYLRADLPREQILDRNDLENISKSITDLFDYAFQEKLQTNAPGQIGMQLVENLLANSFNFHTPLGVELEEEEQKLIELTEQQFRALSLLGNRKKAAIAGCAGSGKTMLAIRKAQQFQELGLNVLFVCYNRALADYLKTRLLDIKVTNFHNLCREAAQQTNVRINSIRDKDKLFHEVYPQALFDAADRFGRVYDAIIVDEGQDFHENYWIALAALLKSEGYFYVFFDDNQNLFHGNLDFGGLITEPAFQLTENCRNTKFIHETVKTFHNNPDSLKSSAPDGRKPEYIFYENDAAMLRNLRQILNQLINEEHIENHNIVILTSRSQERTILKPGTKLGNFTLSQYLPTNATTVQVTTIHSFKGLEKRMVILAEIDQTISHNLDILMYVGCSRARTHLIVLHDGIFDNATNAGSSIPET